ncbi:hypothetical protein ACJ72_01925 [Emergomyces africanus]|uniref:Fungal N-terminal domain-containing protein n=1 Tax=Emergomyces africanus TaxID=1955775 RepID=A0A1B7P3V5_9EURO|nr:hypothetical protein ACJ72_01925 [Emergomyces africanus]
MSEIGDTGTTFFSDANPPKLTSINPAAIKSVLDVRSFGSRLSSVLNHVALEVVDKGIDVHSIARSVSLYVEALKQVGQSFQEMDSPHSLEAVHTAHEISQQSRSTIFDFGRMLDTAQRNDGGSIHERFKHSFRKHHVTYLLAHLDMLKMSLLVMCHILQLGKLGATKRNTPAFPGNDLIQQERAEAQNMIMARYWLICRLDLLYGLAESEAMEYSLNENGTGPYNSQLNITTSQQHTIPTRLPVISLGNLDNSLSPMTPPSKDMIRVSSKEIDPLITRWTRVKRYGSEGPDSPRDYLEGTTSSWIQPHSQTARQPATGFRKTYSSLQARVDSDTDESSDNEGRPRRQKVRFAPSGNTSATEEGSHLREESRQINSTDKGRSPTSPSQLRIPTQDTNAYNNRNFDARPHSSLNSARTMPRGIPERNQQRYSHTPNLSPHNHPRSFTSASNHQQFSPNTKLRPSSSHSSHHTLSPSSYPPPINPSNHSPRSSVPYPAHHQLQQEQHQQQHYHSRHHSPSRRCSNNDISGQQRRDHPYKDDRPERRKDFKRSAATGILGAVTSSSLLHLFEDL